MAQLFMAVDTTSGSTVVAALGSATLNAIPVLGIVDDTIKVVTETEKIVEQQTSLRNTPAMQASAQSKNIQDLEEEITKEVEDNSVEEDRKGI